MLATIMLTANQEPTWLEKIDKTLGSIGNIETLHGLLYTAIGVAIFVVSLLFFRKRVNSATSRQIQIFIKAKKYIPELFTELNDNLDNLRYFVFSNRWKRRIISKYNRQFKNAQGKEIAHVLSNDILTERLPKGTNIEKLMEAITARKAFLETIRKDRQENYQKYGDKFFFIRTYIYPIPEELDHMYEQCELIKNNAIIMVGSAGNGKTTLLCRLSELITNNKMPCLLINSRDIEGDCYDYIVSRIVPAWLASKHRIYLTVVSALLFLTNKYLFVAIDAINENDTNEFSSSIGNAVSLLSKHKRIKVVCSCRSEYFDARYKKYFEKCDSDPYIFRLDQVQYDERAKEKMMAQYRQYYGVNVPLSMNVRDRLMHSLLLMRLFFEVNKGRSGENLELCDAEIYKSYFEKVVQDLEPFDFRNKVDEIAKIMVSEMQFKEVKITDLKLSTEDYKRFRNLLDDNLVISRTVLTGKGITEDNVEYVYFVFDELRDFCIARYILRKDEANGNAKYSDFFSLADKLYDRKSSPLEGVLKYAYYHFRKAQNTELCKKILDKYSDYNPNFDEWGRWKGQRERIFSNFGLSLIFQSASELMEFELDFLVACMIKSHSDFWNVFYFLLRNEFAGASPSVGLIVSLLFEKISYEDISKIVSGFFADRDNKYYYRSEPREVDTLCDAVEKLAKYQGDISIEVKTFMVILAALEPHEGALVDYQFYAQEVLDSLQNKDSNPELVQKITELRDSCENRNTLSIEEIFKIMFAGGFAE